MTDAEKPKTKDAPSNNAVIGRYILDKDIFKFLKNQKKGKGGEIHITDAIKKMISKKYFFVAHKFSPSACRSMVCLNVNLHDEIAGSPNTSSSPPVVILRFPIPKQSLSIWGSYLHSKELGLTIAPARRRQSPRVASSSLQ